MGTPMRSIRHQILPGLLVLALLLAGCASLGEPELVSEAPSFGEEAGEAAADFDRAATDTGAPSALPAAQSPSEIAFQQPQLQERLIIRTGWLTIIAADTEAALQQIGALAETNGGWIVSSEARQRGEAKTGNITVRIPAARFNQTLDEIKALAVEVTDESTSGQDVTEEFVDLNARLSNLEATAERVRGFLDQSRNVEEALAVNQELSRLESDIEVIKGRLQFLSQSAAFSTVNVTVRPDTVARPIEVGGWRPEGVAKDAIEALVSTLQGLANFLIWVVIYVLPVGLLLLIPAWLGFRVLRGIWRRLRRSRRPALAPAGAEPPATDQ